MQGKTLPLPFRREALDRLERAIVRREAEINAALQSDLGKSATESYMCEVGMTLSELRSDLMSRGLAAASESDRMVLLEVAPDVPYERYFQVITMISEAGGIVAMLTE